MTDYSLITMMLGTSVLTLGNGILIPIGTAGVIGSFPELKGYASGLLGFMQLLCAGISSALVGILSKGIILYLGIYMAITTLIGATIFYGLLKHGE